METDQTLTIIEQIQSADIYSILFITMVFLPILLAAWITVFKSIELSKRKIKIITTIILAIYIVSTGILKIGTANSTKYEIASKRIKSYLKANEWDLIGLKRIENNINKNYNSKFIDGLIDKYPLDFSLIDLLDSNDPIGLKYTGEKQKEKKEFEEAHYKITQYLTTTFPEGKRFSGFKKIREYVDSRYDNSFLEELIQLYPDSLIRTNLTDPDDLIGLKLPGN